MSIASSAPRSSTARTRRHRARRRQGTSSIRVDVSETDVAAMVARSDSPEEASEDTAAIKAAIEGVIADVVFELESRRSTQIN